MSKENIPLISQLLKAIIFEDYSIAVDIITSDKFNPNETNKSWNAPVLTAIINVLDGLKNKVKDEKNLRLIMKEITKHSDFNPNLTDAEGETIMMHIARHEEFNWLAPFILSHKDFDINIKNFMHKDAISVAEKCGNNVLVDILLSYKCSKTQHNGLPKKKIGAKKIKKADVVVGIKGKNELLLNHLEGAFLPEVKGNPVSLYNLMISFFKGEIDRCIQIIRDVNFNPNECDRWEEPGLSSLIYYSQDSTAEYDEESFKKVVDAFIECPRFDVNALDSDCNTILMVSMGFPKLKWLTEKLFSISSARIDVINDNGDNLREIAKNCGTEDFYNHLVMKSFETANVVN